MNQNSDAKNFGNLIIGLNTAKVEHLLYLCKIYSSGDIPLDSYLPKDFAAIIRLVNQLEEAKRERLVLFLEGFTVGIVHQSDRQSVISQNTFIVGGQSTINNHVTSQTNSTNLTFNFEPSLFAQAVEKGLINKSDMKELMEIINKSVERQSDLDRDSQN